MSNFNFKAIVFLLLIYFLNHAEILAQSFGNASFQKIDQENGLSDNSVECIYKDRNGFMWIGTHSGLNLMDGSDITIFKNNPYNTNSISSNAINDITDDTTGLLWIATKRGLNSFDPFLRKFTTYPLREGAGTRDDNITSLAIDTKNNLFIATPSGLFYLNKTSGKITYIEMPGVDYQKILNNNITHIAVDKSGLLWLSTFNGLWSYDENSKKFTHEINSSNDPQFTRLFTYFIIGNAGKLWIGTWDKGLKEFDPVSKKITTYPLPLVKQSNIVCITETEPINGKYLVYINGNSCAFDPDQDKFIIPNGTSKPDYNSSVNVLYTTPDNWLWMGKDDGLYFYNPSKNLIINHRFQKPITGQAVSVSNWQNKILVAGEGDNFLKAFDENLIETNNFSNNSTKNISCLSMCFYGKDQLMAGTSAGIADINLATGKIDFKRLPDSPRNSTSINFITNLFRDKNHSWWLFPWRKGIWVADSLSQNPHQVFNNFLTEYNIPKPLVISCAVEDKNDNLWMGDYDEGVIFYDRKTNKFSKPFIKEIGERNIITKIIYTRNYCYSFLGSEILKWNVDQKDLQQIKLPDQIDKAINSISLDSAGHLWIATMNGLLSYDLAKKSFNIFTTSDGLLSNEMDGVLYCLPNGKIVFASPEYLSEFDPQKVLESISGIPKIKLVEVVIGGTIALFDTTHKMSFSHDVNNFIFKWAITDFNNPLNNRYYYRLQGIDKDWRFTGKKGEVEFANLSPGNYTLLLKGENSNGISANKIIKLHFNIRPPFWNTWWFLVLLLGSIIAIFYSFYRYRIRQLLQIEKLRNKISLDLHDDIGSTLSSISILSEIALHQKKDFKTDGMLKEIKENSISMMERMDDIVWSINPKNDSLDNLFLRIKTFSAKLFEAKGINYKIDIDENVKHVHVLMEYRQHIYLIMKEAINNLVKYSECTETDIKVSFHSPLLTVTIKDNGKGYDPNQITYGNGLNNMKKRANEMDAKLDMQSKLNEGTIIILKVKIK